MKALQRLATPLALAPLLLMLLSPLYASVTGVRVSTGSQALSYYQGALYLDGVGFTGVLFAEYPGGVKKKETGYKNGRRDGESLRWYTDGSLSNRTVFVDGNRDGEAVGWWPNGQLQFVRTYRADLLEGETLEWNESGQLRYRQNFSAGREDGLQQGWHEDGESSFNYVYQNGRRYGVLGSKPCFSVTTDATEVFNENL